MNRFATRLRRRQTGSATDRRSLRRAQQQWVPQRRRLLLETLEDRRLLTFGDLIEESQDVVVPTVIATNLEQKVVDTLRAEAGVLQKEMSASDVVEAEAGEARGFIHAGEQAIASRGGVVCTYPHCTISALCVMQLPCNILCTVLHHDNGQPAPAFIFP